MIFHFTTFINTVLKLNKLDYILVVKLVAILSVKKIYSLENIRKELQTMQTPKYHPYVTFLGRISDNS